jgi:hypothetical protein
MILDDHKSFVGKVCKQNSRQLMATDAYRGHSALEIVKQEQREIDARSRV